MSTGGDIVKTNAQEAKQTIDRLKVKAEDARSFINGTVTSDIVATKEWWIGAASDTFQEDFKKTKANFIKNIIDEIIAYSKDMEKAVEKLLAEDDANKGRVKIN